MTEVTIHAIDRLQRANLVAIAEAQAALVPTAQVVQHLTRPGWHEPVIGAMLVSVGMLVGWLAG